MKAGPIQRYRRLSSEQRRLLSRSVMLLTAASAAVALLPFRRALAIGSVAICKHGDAVDPFDCVWAVEAAARRLPWRTMCIEKGLAVQRMLRQSGVDARLHYGARHHPLTKVLQAHVWVTVDGRAVIGGEEAKDFALVATYPELHRG